MNRGGIIEYPKNTGKHSRQRFVTGSTCSGCWGSQMQAGGRGVFEEYKGTKMVDIFQRNSGKACLLAKLRQHLSLCSVGRCNARLKTSQSPDEAGKLEGHRKRECQKEFSGRHSYRNPVRST